MTSRRFTTTPQYNRRPGPVDRSLLQGGASKRAAAMDGYSDPKFDRLDGWQTCSVPENDNAKPKERQRRKIKDIGAALCQAGHVSLDEQARVLGLCRSTTWVLLQANHKSAGPSAT